LLAAVMTAAFFTLQHLPLFFANGTALVIILALFFVMAIGFRVLVGWVYNLAGNLFLVGLPPPAAAASARASSRASTTAAGSGPAHARGLRHRPGADRRHPRAARRSRTPGAPRSSRGCFERSAVSGALVRCGALTGACHIGQCR